MKGTSLPAWELPITPTLVVICAAAAPVAETSSEAGAVTSRAASPEAS